MPAKGGMSEKHWYFYAWLPTLWKKPYPNSRWVVVLMGMTTMIHNGNVPCKLPKMKGQPLSTVPGSIPV